MASTQPSTTNTSTTSPPTQLTNTAKPAEAGFTSPTPQSQQSTNPTSPLRQQQPQTANGTFTLLLFASAQSYTSHDLLTLPAPTTLPHLFNHLEERWPGIKRKVLRSAAVTVNLEYVEFEVDEAGDVLGGAGAGGGDGTGLRIQIGDEVGIVPPVSSG